MRRGTMSRPGASSPQCDSVSQKFTVRMPWPEKRAVLVPVRLTEPSPVTRGAASTS